MDASPSREQLREMFTQAAELYDRMRPSYPGELFDDLATFAQLAGGSRVLEIGCGTGQATRALAERGYRVTAVDLGANMVAIARRNLAGFAHVRVELDRFESWPLPAKPFDAVVSATAYHWLDPAVRVTKTAAALRPGGALAIVATHHVAGGDVEFFEQAQLCYERWDPSTPPGLRLSPGYDIPTDTTEFDESALFDPAVIHSYEWTHSYTTSEYRDLLLTYSGHRALDATARQQLLDCITDLIEKRFSGRIAKQYMNQLYLLRRR